MPKRKVDKLVPKRGFAAALKARRIAIESGQPQKAPQKFVTALGGKKR